MINYNAFLDVENGLLFVLGNHYDVDQALDYLGLYTSRRLYRSTKFDKELNVQYDVSCELPVDVCIRVTQGDIHTGLISLVISPSSDISRRLIEDMFDTLKARAVMKGSKDRVA